jgi:hypothetical protein
LILSDMFVTEYVLINKTPPNVSSIASILERIPATRNFLTPINVYNVEVSRRDKGVRVPLTVFSKWDNKV